MNIGILTLSVHGNYGGVLQNFALNEVLKRHGHNACTIDYKRQKHQRIKINVFRLLRQIGGGNFIRQISNLNPKFAFLYHIRTFADKHITFTKVLKTKQEVELASSKFDAIIVGSDQVWRYIFIYDDVGAYFLDFVKDNVKRIAYAASVGVDTNEYPDAELEKVRSLYTKFDAVSVRERSSVNLIKSLWAPKPVAEHVLDPTMLLDAEDYRKVISQEEDVKKPNAKNLFYYVLDTTSAKKDGIKKIAEAKGLKPYTIYSTDGAELKAILKKGFSQKVEQWLSCIDNADFVVTDSFHGCVFCILFNKQFVVYGNKERGLSRFTSLLGMFGLENRLVDADVSMDEVLNLEDIDYGQVNKLLDDERKKSLKFLLDNLTTGKTI